jgi:outer membrane protein assembly factor BamE (lipoprotein component of BamABCDE complex)
MRRSDEVLMFKTRHLVLNALLGLGALGCSNPAPTTPAVKAFPGQSTGPKPARFSFEEYQLLRHGMAESQIRGVLGEPAQAANVGGFTVLTYGEPQGGKGYVIKLQYGALVQRIGNMPGATDPARLVPENLDKVKEGMATDKVLELLGPPTSAVDADPEGKSPASMTWGSEEAPIMKLIFANDKVAKVAIHKKQ